jgi:hypothetical protein
MSRIVCISRPSITPHLYTPDSHLEIHYTQLHYFNHTFATTRHNYRLQAYLAMGYGMLEHPSYCTTTIVGHPYCWSSAIKCGTEPQWGLANNSTLRSLRSQLGQYDISDLAAYWPLARALPTNTPDMYKSVKHMYITLYGHYYVVLHLLGHIHMSPTMGK